MNEETKIAFLNWMHQISAVTQELCITAKMPFHADQISAHARFLHDAIMQDTALRINIQHQETGRFQEWPLSKPIPRGWAKVSEPFELL